MTLENKDKLRDFSDNLLDEQLDEGYLNYVRSLQVREGTPDEDLVPVDLDSDEILSPRRKRAVTTPTTFNFRKPKIDVELKVVDDYIDDITIVKMSNPDELEEFLSNVDTTIPEIEVLKKDYENPRHKWSFVPEVPDSNFGERPFLKSLAVNVGHRVAIDMDIRKYAFEEPIVYAKNYIDVITNPYTQETLLESFTHAIKGVNPKIIKGGKNYLEKPREDVQGRLSSDWEPKPDNLEEIMAGSKKVINEIKGQNIAASLAQPLGMNTADLLNLIPHNKELRTDEMSEHTKSVFWNRSIRFKGNYSIRLGEPDRDIIKFLAKFKHSIVPIMKNINGISEIACHKQCERLKAYGLLDSIAYPAIGLLWFLTATGHELSGSRLGRSISSYRAPSPAGMSPSLAAQWVASFLWNNRANTLNLSEFPYNGKLHVDSYVRGETLISENEIKSSQHYKLRELIEENDYAKAPYPGFYSSQVGYQKHKLFNEWTTLFNNDVDVDSPEFFEGNEFCWNVYPTDTVIGQTYHPPDLVVRRERLDNGAPQSIAVEIERKTSTVNDYKQTFLCYKEDPTVYSKVVWIINEEWIANRVREGAREAGFEDYLILPFIDEHGAVNFKSPWYI